MRLWTVVQQRKMVLAIVRGQHARKRIILPSRHNPDSWRSSSWDQSCTGSLQRHAESCRGCRHSSSPQMSNGHASPPASPGTDQWLLVRRDVRQLVMAGDPQAAHHLLKQRCPQVRGFFFFFFFPFGSGGFGCPSA